MTSPGDASPGDAPPGDGLGGLATTELAAAVVRALLAVDRSVATAESLTGGLVSAALTTVPGASAVVRGGVVSYATEVKQSVLGVPGDLLETLGAVSAETAVAMADGTRRVLEADWGVATTGVAGPDPAEGKPVGRVHLAVTGPPSDGAREEVRLSRTLNLTGTRDQIRDETVRQALDLLLAALEGDNLRDSGTGKVRLTPWTPEFRSEGGIGDGSATT